ncbi:MAG: phosphatidylserine synthase [Caulobacter sp.]|nr:phosphatidylserine synthase [Caulobacter sp.]
MKVLYLPVYRVPVSYTVSFGRRWSVLEHILLVDLAQSRRSVKSLSEDCGLPERIVVEALINLLRAGWIEVRTSDDVALFSVTELGRKRSSERNLKAELKRRVRRASLCMDRLTGSWMNSEPLDLIHEREVPDDADCLTALISSLDTQNAEVRQLLPLNDDEAFERLEPNGKTAGRYYARIEIGINGISGLPPEAPWRLTEALLSLHREEVAPNGEFSTNGPLIDQFAVREDIDLSDLIVGGPANRNEFRRILHSAQSHVIVHSCFLHPETLRELIPDLEAAAARKVRVELLWGLIIDPEDVKARQSVADCIAVLSELSDRARSRVTLSNISSNSHLKAIVSDSGVGGHWQAVVGSCNFLSSWYDLTEVAVRLSNPKIVAQVLGYLVDAQLPPSGGWSPMVVRLNNSWSKLQKIVRRHVAGGSHTVKLLMDRDHHACVRHARDATVSSIVVACDLFGLAAETSVLVPLQRAHELGKQVSLIYRRPSKALVGQGALPDAGRLAKRGLSLSQVDGIHGKFLLWGNDGLAITSFNWLSTSVGARTRGAELGVMIEGPRLRSMLASHLESIGSPMASLLTERQGVLPLHGV